LCVRLLPRTNDSGDTKTSIFVMAIITQAQKS
jgi:hypothetical protein